MAAAGIVTGDSSVFEEMVASSPKQIRELALASRALIFDVLPQTVRALKIRPLIARGPPGLDAVATTHRVPPIA